MVRDSKQERFRKYNSSRAEMSWRESGDRRARTNKRQANLVNYVPLKITSHISYRINTINSLFPNWDHAERNLNLLREQSKYITLSEAKLILERAANRTYCRTAVTKRIIRHNLGLKSGGKMSQWLVDKEAFEKYVNLERGAVILSFLFSKWW